jgi:hypothetical protein
MTRGLPILIAMAASLMVAVPAAAQPPSPAAEKAVDRLIVAQHLKDQLGTMLPMIIDRTIRLVMQGQDASREAEVRTIVSEEFTTSFSRTIPAMVAKHRELYLAMYSADELAGLAGFYESALGQKFVRNSQLVQGEMAKFGAEAGRAAGIDAQTRIIDRLRKAKFNVPAGI